MKNLTTPLTLFALLCGVTLTAWGLFHLSWPQALPWAGAGALFKYLVFMVICALLVSAGSLRSKRNPLIIGCVIAATIALLSSAVWPMVVMLWFAFASAILGKVIFVTFRINIQDNWLSNFLLGAGVYGTVTGLLAHFPVNYPSVYALALALPILLWRRYAAEYWRLFIVLFSKNDDADFSKKWLEIAITVVALVHFVVALMPELGHDALAMHLFIPAHMASRHQWGFDADTYAWALMPMLGDWIFAVGYLLAGETAVRLISVSFIFVTAWLARDLVIWAGGTDKGARWAVLIFLSTPLTFTESSSLFIESVWAAFVVAGILAILRLCESSDKSKSWIVLAAMLLGFAVATKAVTLTILPVLLLHMLWNYKSCLKATSFQALLGATGLFLFVGLIPYLTAWRLTGNPVFPFFNGIFQSQYYPPVNFDSATVFGKGLTWDVLYRATFDSGRYLEATAGASGFQWLLLFLPTSILLIIRQQVKGITLIIVAVLMVFAVFQSVSYLRYAYPVWALLAAAMGLALGNLSNENNGIKTAWTIAASATVLLNLLFLNSGAQYRDFPIKSVWDTESRDAYLKVRLPIRNAVELVNQLNVGRSPVAVFAHPLTAGIKSDVLYSNWYNFRFQADINTANTLGEVANVLLRRGVDLVILDSNWSGGVEKRALIIDATELIAEYGSISVRRVKKDYRFKTELLKSPDFSLIDNWSLSPGAEYDVASKIIIANVAASATQAIAVSPGLRYLNTVVSRCSKSPSVGRIQINWLDFKGKFVNVDIKTFECTPEWAEYSMEVAAPSSATLAIVYVTGHTGTPIEFKSNSLRQ
jgi:hypothetical protein